MDFCVCTIAVGHGDVANGSRFKSKINTIQHLSHMDGSKGLYSFFNIELYMYRIKERCYLLYMIVLHGKYILQLQL